MDDSGEERPDSSMDGVVWAVMSDALTAGSNTYTWLITPARDHPACVPSDSPSIFRISVVLEFGRPLSDTPTSSHPSVPTTR